jgi:hypothetical protein
MRSASESSCWRFFSLCKMRGGLVNWRIHCPFTIDHEQWHCSIKQEYHWIETGKLTAKVIRFANPEPSRNTLQIWNINSVGRGIHSPVSYGSDSVRDSSETESPSLLISGSPLHLRWRCLRRRCAGAGLPACLHGACLIDPAVALLDSRPVAILVLLIIAPTIMSSGIALSVFLKDYARVWQ